MTLRSWGALAFCLALTACGTSMAGDGGLPDSADVCVGRDDGVNCGGGNICLRGSCVVSTCGDNYVHAGEQCDDGNTTAFDGCDSDCTFTCEAATDCTNNDPCDGAESCDATAHVCQSGTMLANGTACASPTVASGTCASGICVMCTVGCVGTVFPERDFVCAAGATQPCDTTEPAHTDAERTAVEPDTLPGSTLTFVLDALAVPRAMDGVAAGFNIDQLDSGTGSTDPGATCEEFSTDYVSLRDPDQIGVDNATQGLIGTIESFLTASDCPGGTSGCLDVLLAQRIASGASLILVEISGVDDLLYDSSVMVQIFSATVPGGAAPVVNAGGTLAAGQIFDSVPLGAPVAGDIFDGRVRAIVSRFTFVIGASGIILPVDMLSPELRFDLSASALDNGQVGGFVRVDDVVAAWIVSDPSLESVVRSVLDGIADITPSTADPNVCTNISVGATFTAVSAARSP